MAEAGHMRYVGDPIGLDWDDWNCDLDPADLPPQARRSRPASPETTGQTTTHE